MNEGASYGAQQGLWAITKHETRTTIPLMPRSRKPRCIARVRAGWNPNAWVPCSRRRAGKSVFCRRHEDAFRGALIGLWMEILRELDSAQTPATRERPN